jgi:hypothetical protein
VQAKDKNGCAFSDVEFIHEQISPNNPVGWQRKSNSYFRVEHNLCAMDAVGSTVDE